MIYFILLLVFSTCYIVVYLLLNTIFAERIAIQSRLKKVTESTEKVNTRVEGSFFERLTKPMRENSGAFIKRVTPKNYMMQLEKKLREAGNPLNMNASKLVALQGGMFVGEIILVLSMWISFHTPVQKVMAVMALLIGITYMFPRIYLKQKVQTRQKEIETTLPDVIDILTVSIEAGLSFDGAMGKLVEKMNGVLVQEFAIVLKEMKMGVSKREALKNLLERAPVSDLVTFVGAVIQADQLGVSVGNVLRIQSGLMRQKRRQRASEQAMKAPVKMLFPMVFLILPTIFIILLGPAAINVIKTLSK